MNSAPEPASKTPSKRTMQRLMKELESVSRRRRGKPITKSRANADDSAVREDHANKVAAMYKQYPKLLEEVIAHVCMCTCARVCVRLEGQIVCGHPACPSARSHLFPQPGRIANADETPQSVRELMNTTISTALMPVYGKNKTHSPTIASIHSNSESHITMLAA
jgi:hypothetical protein